MHLRCAILFRNAKQRYYSVMQNSDIFATRNMFRVANVVESTLSINPHAAQFAAYRAAGISLAVRQISQIREDLYRFSLSALSDKLNFPRGARVQKVYGNFAYGRKRYIHFEIRFQNECDIVCDANSDIILLCRIAIYLQREICFVLQMWWKVRYL